MSAQFVVDISSDEEDNATKSSTKNRATGSKLTDSTRTAVKSPSKTSPKEDRPTIPAGVIAGCSENPMSTQSRHQSTDATPTQEAAKDRAISTPQITAAASTNSFPTTPISTPEQEPPKPTPLDINEFRHLVSAGSMPAKDSPLIMSIQPITPAINNKRKATDTFENNHLSRRPRPSSPLLPPTPYTGTSEHPVPPRSNNNSLLWSVPAYEPPPPSSSVVETGQSKDQKQNRNTTSTTRTPTNPPAICPKQPSIPNIHLPLTSTSTSTSTPPPIITKSATAAPAPTTTPKPRQRETKWTTPQLANLASALEAAFFPTVDAFAAENKKTVRQVKEAFSFLCGKRIWEFCDEEGKEGGKEGRKGRGRGKGKVARRLEREMRADRLQTAKEMRQVHRKEASEGHWASEGMLDGDSKGRGKGEGKR